MKDLTNSVLLNSIQSDPLPQDKYEEFNIIHTGINIRFTLEELILKLNEYKDNGYQTIQFRPSPSDSTYIELQKRRSVNEIFEYRLHRVHHSILRQLKDGKNRQIDIIKSKEESISNFEKRMTKLQNRKIPIQDEMLLKLDSKKIRLSYYEEKVQEIEKILAHYENYTYSELNNFPQYFFHIGGRLK